MVELLIGAKGDVHTLPFLSAATSLEAFTTSVYKYIDILLG